jgi:hypothetical protein
MGTSPKRLRDAGYPSAENSRIEPSPRGWGARLSRDEWELVVMVLIVKALLFWYGMLSFEIHYNKWILTRQDAIDLLNHWDVGQYLNIATLGYGPTGDARLRLAFYPLYPWLIRLLTPVFRSPHLAGLAVTTIASMALAVALFRLVKIDFDSDVARRAVWFLFIFPSSYFLHVAYTESLFLLFIVAAFIACRRGRWMYAGVYGALATLTHGPGILLVAAFGVEGLHELWLTRRWNIRWLWVSLIPLGFGFFMFVNYHITGDPLAFVTVAGEHWTNQLTVPWAAYNQLGVNGWMSPADAITHGMVIMLFVVGGLVATIASAWWLRPCYTMWMASNWLIIAMQSWDMSAPRLMLAMFPIFILEAMVSRNRLASAALNLWSMLFLALFCGEFFKGHWAF